MKRLIFISIFIINIFADNNNATLSYITYLTKSRVGYPYEYGKSGEDSFDCSGFVYYIFKKRLNIDIPRTSKAQSEMSKNRIVDKTKLKVGDILFFDTADRGHVNHSGIYLGNMHFIHSSSGKAYGVTISPLDRGFYKDRFLWGIRVIGSIKN